MDAQGKKLTPMKFLPHGQQMPWGGMEYKLADLGFVDSMACEGYLGGNTLSDIMQTYLERVVGETAFEWYGTQFPVLVKRLQVKGRTALHVNPDDDTAAQRYDAFGKTALWYVEKAGPDARLFLGFRKTVSAAAFYKACMEGTVRELLQEISPREGECYLVPPGMVHAAQDVTLLEVAESSELSFRLHDWGSTERELHLEEAFDLIDLSARPVKPVQNAVTEQFTLNLIPLSQALQSRRDVDDTFLVYLCLKGSAALRADGKDYPLKAGELVLVPAEVNDFLLLPAAPETLLMEVRMDPRPEQEDIIGEEKEELWPTSE